jgi:integrase
MKDISFPFEVKRGSVTVKIYRTPTKGHESFTVSYYQDKKRIRSTFAEFADAEREARDVATRLASSNAVVLTLSSADRAAWLRAKELLAPTGTAIEVAAAEYAHAKRLLGETSLIQAVEYFIKQHPIKIPPRELEVVINDLLEAKRQDGVSQAYLKHLRYDLEKFNKAFQCPIGSVTGNQIDEWLRSLGVAPRTRNNLRNSVQTLFNFAKARRYLPRDHDELASVAVAKDNGGAIEIFTPTELGELLAQAPDILVPFLALGAFAGIRHAEVLRLDWRDIHFDDGLIEVRANKAKTASRRLIPLADNLRAWLEDYRETSGLVCSSKNVAKQICQIVRQVNAERKAKRKMAGLKTRRKDDDSWLFKWKHNALRHSYISYRVAQTQDVAKVSLEAGNSPQMIFKHYRELVRPKDAEAWFNIKPDNRDEGKVVQLEQKVA